MEELQASLGDSIKTLCVLKDNKQLIIKAFVCRITSPTLADQARYWVRPHFKKHLIDSSNWMHIDRNKSSHCRMLLTEKRLKGKTQAYFWES